MKVVALLLAVSLCVTARSQNTINAYKYVLVPKRFDFLKADNQYGLNTYSKALLADVGFTAFLTDEMLPAELAGNKCNALKMELEEKNSMFATGLTLVLKDCLGNVVYRGKEGKSREKDWAASYSEALRNAFASLSAAQYKYDSALAAPATPAAVNVAPVVVAAATPAISTENKDVLYAQPTATGYQLIDTSPKKVMTLLKTSQQDTFIADDGDVKGIVFKRNGEWFFEYYKEDKHASRKLNIKF
ncbi:hypothetical protein SAMN05421788_11816 [Filimonas lacunae]|uniref:Uncharacterized protein n=1 Tax=Filimonas lacunae TaxID=477680 RepID=A0A173MBF8_9BACT|nr:hypothetical protein [Filimonas lacunae]BAV04866.1 hypothetical protein FLA_0866 [Filimonas lacunae]SIT34646.1 hypothetical protein SAMN05421788_11816 [Filimonas lacunae]